MIVAEGKKDFLNLSVLTKNREMLDDCLNDKPDLCSTVWGNNFDKYSGTLT
jgi:hypothetical protein